MPTASCACGRLSIDCEGEPAKVSLCHCLACQRRTGGPFGIAAFYPRDKVRPGGEDRRYVRPSDTGFDVVFHFCPHCGGTVWWEPQRKPDMVAVAPGAFAAPNFPAPDQSVHEETRHSWVVGV